MRVLATRVGATSVMIPASQVQRVLASSDTGDLPIFGLAEVLGLPTHGDAAEGRVLLCQGRARTGAMGLRVTGGLDELDLGARSLIALPRLLARLQPAPWLAGLARRDAGLALVVDLARLTDELLRPSPETPGTAERMQ